MPWCLVNHFVTSFDNFTRTHSDCDADLIELFAKEGDVFWDPEVCPLCGKPSFNQMQFCCNSVKVSAMIDCFRLWSERDSFLLLLFTLPQTWMKWRCTTGSCLRRKLRTCISVPQTGQDHEDIFQTSVLWEVSVQEAFVEINKNLMIKSLTL